jgi:hypothetical protein
MYLSASPRHLLFQHMTGTLQRSVLSMRRECGIQMHTTIQSARIHRQIVAGGTLLARSSSTYPGSTSNISRIDLQVKEPFTNFECAALPLNPGPSLWPHPLRGTRLRPMFLLSMYVASGRTSASKPSPCRRATPIS